MIQVALKALGCRLNEAELEAWAQQFKHYGYGITGDVAQADLLVINTCAVTREAVKKSRQLIRRSQRRNPNARLVVSGCYASLARTADDRPPLAPASDLAGIDLLIPNQDKETLVAHVHRQLGARLKPPPAGEADTRTHADADAPADDQTQHRRNRAFIKVQDGCRYQCTFCIVTVARGDERSKPVRQVVDEINAAQAQGIKEIVLTGVHIGGYGSDADTSLVTLIQTIIKETDIPRIRLGSVEPWNLGEDFLALFTHARMMPHLHLPMQSGADTVLRRMARRCKTAAFIDWLVVAREQVQDLNITTDMIVGFPGETDSEWQQTLAFVRACRFSHIHIFPYSARPGTYAASLPGQVDAATKKQRCRALRSLAEAMKLAYMQTFIGRECEVLIEHARDVHDGEAAYSGYAPNYLRVAIPAQQGKPYINRIVPVQITGYSQAQQRLQGQLRPHRPGPRRSPARS